MGSQLLCMLLENLILCLEWILGIFGFRIEPSTILFKGNLKSHIYEVKHKITKFLFFNYEKISFHAFAVRKLLIDPIDRCKDIEKRCI